MMDTSDIAAAALKPDHKGKCNCARGAKNLKPISRCPKCKGTGILTACDACEGSGWDKNTNSTCGRCGGKGFR
jgi:DnaJ-class molecular chaperone